MKKFFIGVPWLGPDLSFFRQLKQQQAARTEPEMSAWQGGQKLDLALAISKILANALGWKSQFFLPEDSADVVFHGHGLGLSDPEAAIEDIIQMLQARYGIRVPAAFWHEVPGATMGELVDRFLALR